MSKVKNQRQNCMPPPGLVRVVRPPSTPRESYIVRINIYSHMGFLTQRRPRLVKAQLLRDGKRRCGSQLTAVMLAGAAKDPVPLQRGLLEATAVGGSRGCAALRLLPLQGSPCALQLLLRLGAHLGWQLAALWAPACPEKCVVSASSPWQCNELLQGRPQRKWR